MIPVLLSITASVMLGVGVALQHEAAAAETDVVAMDPRLLQRLVTRKKWLAGVGLGTFGAMFQGAAIATGLLIVVAPIAALHVAVALAFASFRSKRMLASRHWLALAAAVVGLAAFLIAASPQEAADARPALPWAVLLVGVGVAVACARLLAPRLHVSHAAMILAAAAGIGFGHADGMVKVFTGVADSDGWGAVPSHWALAAFGVLSPVCFWLQQSAHNMADITASLPATSAIQPAVGALLGAVMFGESIRGGAAVPVEVFGVVLLLAGVVVLASTPLPQPRLAIGLAEN